MQTGESRRRLKYATHFSVGIMWGAAYGIAVERLARAQGREHGVRVVYAADVLLNTALDLYHPTQWSARDLVIDVVDKYVQAQATAAVFDRLLDPTT